MDVQAANAVGESQRDLDEMARGWILATAVSKRRLQIVRALDDDDLEKAVSQGKLVLETVCLMVHCNIRGGQFNLPPEFWKILYSEYGIIVYPSAWTHVPDLFGLGEEVTFADIYQEHIVMLGRPPGSTHPPPDPFIYLTEPPPVYQK